MEITLRDREMMQWINGHGFVTIAQACRWMGVHYQTAQRRMHKLCQGQYLKRNRFEFGKPRVHWPSVMGWEISSDKLVPLKAINRVTYFHDLTLVDVAHWLVEETGGAFVPERRLKENLVSKGRRLPGHLPDGLLYIDDQEPIAIELEMSVKNGKKLREIIARYSTNSALSEIWYIATNNEVENAVRRAIQKNPRFKVRRWELEQ